MAQHQVRPLPTAFAQYPIPLELLAALHRASADDVEGLVSRVPETGRARLAAYCTDKDHLHDLGLRIAGTCDEASLVRVVGPEAGTSLYRQSRTQRALQA